MKQERFEPLLTRVEDRRKFPACEDAEDYWAQYLLIIRKAEIQLVPQLVEASGLNGAKYSVGAIQIDPNSELDLGPNTYLVVHDLPGLLLTNHHRIIRPLMQIPKGYILTESLVRQLFVNEFDINESDKDWYPKGMARLLNDVVKDGIDQEGFMETLREYEKICNHSF